MKYHFYKNSEETWRAMLEAIKGAKKTIYWEGYILSDDTHPDFDFFEVIKKKSLDGVKVKIVVDGFGSAWYEKISDRLMEELRSAGVEILFFNRWFHRIHRKILIIDEKFSFLGGVNVAKKYREWLDLHISMDDKDIAKSLTKSFANSYFFSGGKDQYLLSIKENSKVRKAQLWILDHFPFSGKFLLKRYYTERFAMAEKSITIVTPYFFPRPWFIKSLSLAANKGVSVEILLPNEIEGFMTNFANHIFASALNNSGIKFFMVKKMNHAKALLIDDKEGLVGSNNIDSQSFNFNSETSLSFKRKDMIEDLKKILEEWKKEAVPFEGHKGHKMSWFHIFLEYIVGKFFQIFL